MKAFYSKIAGLGREFEPIFKAFSYCRLGVQKSILVRGEPGDGQTALALEICKEFAYRNHTVLFFDFNDAILDYRIPDFSNSTFIVIRPDGAEGARKILAEFRKEGLDEPVICMDSSYLISDTDDIETWKINLDSLRDSLFETFPGSTVIITERKRKKIRNFSGWSEVVEMSYNRKITRDREEMGHIIDIVAESSRSEISQAFVDYKLGRLSVPFDVAKYQIEIEGLQPSGYFDYKGERYRGLWNFVFDGPTLGKFYE